MNLQRVLTGACFAASAAATPVALQQRGVAVQFGVYAPAPVVAYVPPPVVAYVPAPRYGYVWVPGYRVWRRDHYVWTRGHWARQKHHRHYDRYAYRY